MKKENIGKAIIGLNISLAVCFVVLALQFFCQGQVLSGIFNLLSSALQADAARINHSILFAKKIAWTGACHTKSGKNRTGTDNIVPVFFLCK
jgi:hypothetical protein